MPQARRLIALFTCSLAACSLYASPAIADEMEACATAAERAQPKRKSGELTAARAELVTCSRSVCPAVIRNDCQKWLGDVDRALGTVILRVVDETGHDLVDIEVTLDDKPFTSKLDGRPLSVDPGVHVLRYSATGRTPITERIVVRETEKNRLVNVTLKSSEIPIVAEKPVPLKPEPTTRSINPLVYVFGGVAVAAIGTGVALWLVGSGERGDLRDGCAKTSSCSDDAIDSAKTKLIVGDVLVAVGAVAAAAGVWIALSSKPSSAALRVLPTNAGAQVGLGGAF